MVVAKFSVSERHLLKDIVVSERNKGKSFADAFRIAAVKLKKEEKECTNQWYNRLSKKYGNSIMTPVAGNANKSIWTDEEDAIVTRAILKAKAAGQSIIKGTKNAALKLPNRSADACSTRWYTYLRAKSTSLNVDNTPITEAQKEFKPSQLLSQINEYIDRIELRVEELETQVDKSMRENKRLTSLNQQHIYRENEVQELQTQVQVLQIQVEQWAKKYSILKQDHDATLRVFENARKLTADEELGESPGKVTFKMDSNGNLEKVPH